MELLILAGLFLAAFAIREVSLSKERAAWQRERSELLTRIQAPREAPALIAAPPRHGPVRKPVDPVEPDHAEFALVGTIQPETGESA